MEKEKVLQVKTLGGFSLLLDGERLFRGGKSKDSQFIRLMEILLHYREKGVDRRDLEELLLGDSRSEDSRHMLRTIVYNARQKLKKSSLPGEKFIITKGGRYYWDSEIPVLEDAQEFEKLCEKALAEEDREKHKKMCLEACFSYTGEFLPEQTRFVWVSMEENRYAGLFSEIVEKTAEILREDDDFDNMEKLGRHATEMQPLSEWEVITMEGMIGSGKYEEAGYFYEETIKKYLEKLGAKPSEAVLRMADSLGDKIKFEYSLLEEIQSYLSDDEETPGGFFCTYPVFKGMYNMIEHLLMRSEVMAFLLLCVIVDEKGNTVYDAKTLDKLSPVLKTSINDSIRKSDVFCRYGTGQYLILLLNTTRENCDIVTNRISRSFAAKCRRCNISYIISDVDPQKVNQMTEPGEAMTALREKNAAEKNEI